MSDKKQIIVTGGSGYIGSHTVLELLEGGYEPIIFDDFRNSQSWILDRLEEISGQKIQAFNLDCNDYSAMSGVVKTLPNVAGIIHFAADKAVGESVQNPIKYFSNNIGSLSQVLRLANDFKIEHFVFSSSCTVYGEPDNPVVTESTPIQKAESPYGSTKIICEELIQFAYQSGQDLKATLLRYFNPIGAHLSAKIGELPQGIPNNLVPYITQTANGIREKITIFGNDYDTVDGTNVRDYIHVVDLAKAHVKALDRSFTQDSSFCEAYNLGTGKGSSVLEIIHTFEEVNDLKLNYEIGPRRAGDVVQIWADPSKANKELNWHCEYTIKDALKHSWQWEQNIN
ncbi:MAG: UDP-glucose 4-epimerase [Arenicella sp.]|jgi:UDP-glucose 4-epimerase